MRIRVAPVSRPAVLTASTPPELVCGRIVEAVITKARNGLAIDFPDPAMRRRDPDAMVIGDKLPTDKPTYEERFGEGFEKTRAATLDWLKTPELVPITRNAACRVASGRSERQSGGQSQPAAADRNVPVRLS